MLQEVSKLDLADCHGKVGVPKQLFVNTDPSSIPAAVTRAGLSLPLGKYALLTVYIDFVCTYVHSPILRCVSMAFIILQPTFLCSAYVRASMSGKQGTVYPQITTVRKHYNI